MADGSQHSIFIIPESTYGVTPATPAWVHLRVTSCNLKKEKSGSVSSVVRNDRQIDGYNFGTSTVSGDIAGLLTYGEFDALIEAVSMGTWTVDTPALGTDQIKAGEVKRSFSVLRKFDDITDKPYQLYTGVVINNISVTVPTEAEVTVSFSCIGKDMTTSATAPAGSTYGASATVNPFMGVNAVVKEGGATSTIATEASFTLENGRAQKYAIGSSTTTDPTSGQSNLTGSISLYFEDNTLIDKFLGETRSTVDVTCLDDLGNSLRFYQPEVIYTDAPTDVSGIETIIIPMPYQGLPDATEATNLVVERNPI